MHIDASFKNTLHMCKIMNGEIQMHYGQYSNNEKLSYHVY